VQALQPFLDTIYSQRVTHLVAVPTMLALIARFGRGLEDCFKTEDFRFVVSAAARLEAHLWIEFETRFQTRVVNVYGLTETVTGSLFCGPDEATRRTGTLGKPVDCRARVVGADGQDVPPGEEGELRLAGPHLMAGYWLEPEATAAVLQDGWLATGDRVRQDADGFYHLTGRAKSVIISGGHNVAPEEVAEVLNAHPGVREACVLGVEEPDWGEAVVACVVVDAGVEAEALQRHCHAHLSAYKMPARFVFLDALPKGPSGKVQLEAVRGLMAARPDAESGAGGSIAQQVTALAARCFRVAPAELSPASGPHNTLGWSSLANLEFIVALEKAFGIAIGTRDVMTLTTLGDATQIVQRLQQARSAP
jgi:long-chain acyl-CoA synthetase